MRERDVLIQVPWARTLDRDPKKKELRDLQSVRLYPSSPGIATLQIRTEGITTPNGRVPRHVISSAGLGLLEAVRLKNALDLWIGEWSKEQRDEAYEEMVRIEIEAQS